MVDRHIPDRYANRPELVHAVIEARKVQMETEDSAFAVEWLMEHHPMTFDSATRALDDATFRYAGFYPEGHPGLEMLKAEARAKGRRAYQLKKIRVAVIDRDESRCQGCSKRVKGREATLDHKDPEGPSDLENIHLLCRRCNTVKGQMTWGEFQKRREEWQARVSEIQNARPDFICEQTGLSVRGKSWNDAGCLSRDLCSMMKACDNGGFAAYEEAIDKMVQGMDATYDDDVGVTV